MKSSSKSILITQNKVGYSVRTITHVLYKYEQMHILEKKHKYFEIVACIILLILVPQKNVANICI